MATALAALPVLVLDCQAGGATPAHGDLLEIGWATVSSAGVLQPFSRWLRPRTERAIPRAVRELTGYSEACLAEAIDERAAYEALCSAAAQVRGARAAAPTLIHFARFELGFLRDLHARLGGEAPFPLDVLCLHALAERLFPELPRRNIRALAGFLGDAATLHRRAQGHVEMSAFIWRALVPRLAERGVDDFDALGAFLAGPKPPRARRRTFPLAPSARRALPDAPGVYRMVRANGDVLYVGKASSVRLRIASHFSAGARSTERALEMLTQVVRVEVTPCASPLEAALCEVDAIKRFDPPYNQLLREEQRSAWFVTRDLRDARAEPDAEHPLGPLPSARALTSYAALGRLLAGEAATPALCAEALAVPSALLPDPALFEAGLAAVHARHVGVGQGGSRRALAHASRALFLTRGRREPSPSEELPPDAWDLARVERRLERALVQGGLLLRRARLIALLTDADVAYREPGMERARLLALRAGQLVAAEDLAAVGDVAKRAPCVVGARGVRLARIDAAAYDRLRVLCTELARVRAAGGELGVRIGTHVLTGARARALVAST